MAIQQWGTPADIAGLTPGNCDASGNGTVSLSPGDKSRVIYAFNFDFENATPSIPNGLEVDSIRVEIDSGKVAAAGTIIIDELRLAKKASRLLGNTFDDARIKFLRSESRTTGCRPWAHPACGIYSTYYGSPKQWGFRGKRTVNFGDNEHMLRKKWLRAQDVKAAEFGVVFRCTNVGIAAVDCFVRSVKITIYWTQGGGQRHAFQYAGTAEQIPQ